MHVHLALRYQAFLILVHELDRVLDRNDVIASCAIHQVDQGAQGRRFAGACRASHEHQPFGEVTQFLDLVCQPHVLDRDHLGGDHPEDRDGPSAVARGIDPVPGDAGDLVGEIGITRLFPFAAIALGHDRQDQQLEIVDR